MTYVALKACRVTFLSNLHRKLQPRASVCEFKRAEFRVYKLRMQEIQNLTDAQLISETRSVAKNEQYYSRLLIDHLLEVDARKLFAALNYDTLLKYVVKDLGFSESTARERIRVMHLSRKVPELKAKLETGALSLSTAAQVSSFCYYEKLSPPAVQALVEEASNKSMNEVEILLLSKSENSVPREKTRQITPELQEAKLILDPETQALLRRYEELHGKKKVSEILKSLLSEHLKKKDPMKRILLAESAQLPKLRSIDSRSAPVSALAQGATVSVHHSVKREQFKKPAELGTRKHARYVPAEEKRRLEARAQCQCEWRNAETGERCTSRFRLQMDHFPIPYALGGPSKFENLRLVCPAHNARHAVDVYGVRGRGSTL